MNKKEYMKPALQVVELNLQSMIALSADNTLTNTGAGIYDTDAGVGENLSRGSGSIWDDDEYDY